MSLDPSTSSGRRKLDHRGWAVAAVLCLLLAACGSPQLTAPETSRVQVDTPVLRALRQQARIEPCANGPASGGPLPKITVKCLGGGQPVDLSTLRGPLILNFWFSGCGPCREEMPALEAFHTSHPQITLIGVDETDVQPEAALRLARSTGVTYPLIADPGGDLQGTKLGVRAFPTFFLLSADGRLSMARGGLTSEAEVEAMAAKYL